MSTKRFVLVVRADQTVRIVQRPRLAADEVGIPLVLDFPRNWGRMLTDKQITIKVPDFSPEVIQEIEAPSES